MVRGIVGIPVGFRRHKSSKSVQNYGCNCVPFVLAWCLFDPHDEEDTMSNTVEEPGDDPWDAFELDDGELESEPEPGDFWGELDNDCDSVG